MHKSIKISGVDLEIEDRGKGRPLLFLHAGEGLGPERPWLDLLGRHFRVIAPSHPGFGNSALPDWIGTVDDLAYLYLDLAAKLELHDAVLVGASFGGWIAAEVAVRNTAAFGKIVLSAPLGIKNGSHTDRDIADMHSISRDEVLARAWADPAKGQFDASKFSDAELQAIARGRESLALFGWKPYMHNPRLKRWLHRIDKPTLLLWGDRDRIVTPSYGQGFLNEIPGARLEVIKDCGHYPAWERPDEFAKRITEFAA